MEEEVVHRDTRTEENAVEHHHTGDAVAGAQIERSAVVVVGSSHSAVAGKIADTASARPVLEAHDFGRIDSFLIAMYAVSCSKTVVSQPCSMSLNVSSCSCVRALESAAP